MANFFIKRPIFAIVVALVITIAGALCIFSLPIDRYPKITPPQVSVHATYPGADSEVVAQTVAEVIEKNVVGAEGFDNMSSTSNSNGSYSLGPVPDGDGLGYGDHPCTEWCHGCRCRAS